MSSQGNSRAPSRRIWYTIALIIIVVVGLRFAEPYWIRLAPQQHSAMTKRSDLQKLSEEHLFYPGAVVLSSGGNDYEHGIWGSNPAQSGHTLGVVVSKEEILAFYDRELKARGWQWSPGDGAVGSNEIDGNAWRKDRVALQIAILRMNDPQKRLSRSFAARGMCVDNWWPWGSVISFQPAKEPADGCRDHPPHP